MPQPSKAPPGVGPKLEGHLTKSEPVGMASQETPADPALAFPRVQDVTFATIIHCGAKNDRFWENKGQCSLDVDFVTRVVIVTRMDERGQVNTSLVPFENVSHLRYVMEKAT
jgi:hypothetical protein